MYPSASTSAAALVIASFMTSNAFLPQKRKGAMVEVARGGVKKRYGAGTSTQRRKPTSTSVLSGETEPRLAARFIDQPLSHPPPLTTFFSALVSPVGSVVSSFVRSA